MLKIDTAQFEKQLAKVVKQLKEEISFYLSDLQKVGGNIAFNEANLLLVTGFAQSFKKILTDAGYTKLASEFVNDSGKILAKMQQSSKIPLTFTKSNMTSFKAIQRLDFNQLMGIGNSAARTLQTNLVSSVMTGKPYKRALEELFDRLDSNLKSYANTYIVTSRQQFMQKAELLGTENLDVDFEYVGPRDSKNRPECIKGLNHKYFTRKEMQSFESAYGTRWNCRHVFQAVQKRGNG